MAAWRPEALLFCALLAAGPAAGLQQQPVQDHTGDEPLNLAGLKQTIAGLTANPEDEFDIPYEIALTRGDIVEYDPTSDLLTNSEGRADTVNCMPHKRAEVAQGFLRTFNAQYKPRFAAAFKGVKDPAYLTVGDWRFSEMLRNFMLHAHNITCFSSDYVVAVHVGLDKRSYDECQALARGIVQPTNVGSKGKFELRCIDLAGWLPAQLFDERAAQSWSCAYNMLLWTKPHIAVAAVEAATEPVMMIDTDVILHQNVIKFAPKMLRRCRNCVAITGREYASENRQNTGTVYSHKEGLPLLREWARVDPDFLNAKEGDQSAMQSLMQSNHALRRQLAVFNLKDVGECGIPGTYATHYNCLTGKKVNMVRQGHWDTRVYREPAQLRCREPGEALEVTQDTGYVKDGKNLKMPPRRGRIIGGLKEGESSAQQLKFRKAKSCSTSQSCDAPCTTLACEGNPASQAIDGFVNTIAGINKLGMWVGDLGEVQQLARVEITFESCMCKDKGSMLLEVSKDDVTWSLYGSVGELTVFEGTQSVAFEQPLNARYVRVRPAASYTAAPRRGDKWFAIREVEAFGMKELLQNEQPLRLPQQPDANHPLSRRERRRLRRERRQHKRLR